MSAQLINYCGNWSFTQLSIKSWLHDTADGTDEICCHNKLLQDSFIVENFQDELPLRAVGYSHKEISSHWVLI